MTPAVFLDRDGVIIEDVDHITRKEDIKLIHASDLAIGLLNLSPYKVIVVSNQSVVARGLCTMKEVVEINKTLSRHLRGSNAKIDRNYFCPHHPTEGSNPEYTRDCECRKPKIGMLLQAERDLGIDLSRSYVVGDKMTDIEMGRNAGCKTILVETGYGGKDSPGSDILPDFTERDLSDAARRIVSL